MAMIRNERPWRLLVGLALAAGAGWWLAPAGPASGPDAVKLRRDDWRGAVALRRADLTGAAVEVPLAPYWGPLLPKAGPAASAPGSDEPGWRLAGLFGRGAEKRVLLVFTDPAQQPKFLKTGDKLPNGHKIALIHDNDISVRNKAQTYRLPVQRVEP
jgi:hypothetical protein